MFPESVLSIKDILYFNTTEWLLLVLIYSACNIILHSSTLNILPHVELVHPYCSPPEISLSLLSGPPPSAQLNIRMQFRESFPRHFSRPTTKDKSFLLIPHSWNVSLPVTDRHFRILHTYVPSFVRIRIRMHKDFSSDLEKEFDLELGAQLTFHLPSLPYYVHSYANRWTVTHAQQQ